MPSKQLLDTFWELASDDSEKRVKAAVALFELLTDSKDTSDWEYAFKRLLKGLSSSRDSARLGFSTALAELINAREANVTAAKYLDACEEYLKAPPGAKGHEQRACYFGQLFAFQILAGSEIMRSDSTSKPDVVRLLNGLISLAKAKIWLRESAFFTLTQLVSIALPETPYYEEVVEKALNLIDSANLSLTSEGAAFYLSVPRILCATDKWKNGDPLSKGNLKSLANALKESPETSPDAKGGNQWKPALHFSWTKIATELEKEVAKKPGSSEKPKKKAKHTNYERVTLGEFWKTCVDENLFSQTASAEKRFWGFKVFSLFCSVIDWKLANIKDIFSDNFVKCLLHQLASNDKKLHKTAKVAVDSIPVTEEGVAPEILKILHSGSQLTFESKAKSNIVHQLLTNALETDRYAIVKALKEAIESSPAIAQKRAILDRLLFFARANPQYALGPVIDAFVEFGFGEIDDASDSSIQKEFQEQSQFKLLAVMSDTVSLDRSDNTTWAYYTLTLVEERSEKLDIEDDALSKSFAKASKTLKKIHKKRSASVHIERPELRAFEVLFSLVLLQIYCGDADAVGVLDEVQLCYSSFLGKMSADDEDIDASQVLTDILLSFMSKQSSVLRKLSETVWATFCVQATADALQLLLDVLDAAENQKGQSALFDDEAEMDEDEETEDEENNYESDDDAQHQLVNEEAEEDEEEDDDDDDNEDDDDDEDADEDSQEEDGDENEQVDEQAEADAALTSALAKALKISKSEDEDDNEESEESMDDEQMMALDEQLAVIFKTRKEAAGSTASEKRAEMRQAKEKMIQFKFRVLDMLEIYVKNTSSQPSALLTILLVPLLKLMRSTREPSITERSYSLLKRIVHGKNLPSLDPSLDLTEILASIHEEARTKKSIKPHDQACSIASLFVSKILLTADRSALGEAVSSVYSDSLSRWIVKGEKLKPGFFLDLLQWLHNKDTSKEK